jgi:hypothetical protein
MVSVAVGFLYVANCVLFLSFEMVMFKELLLFSSSASIVNCIKGVKLLNGLKLSGY